MVAKKTCLDKRVSPAPPKHKKVCLLQAWSAVSGTPGHQFILKRCLRHANINSYFSDEVLAIYKGPVLIDSKLLLSDQDGIVRILEADTGVELEYLQIGKLALAPIPVNKKVLFLRSDGKLLAYE